MELDLDALQELPGPEEQSNICTITCVKSCPSTCQGTCLHSAS